MFKFIAISLALCALVVGGIVLLLPGVFKFDTQYAPNYSERAFRSLRIGDPEERAYRLLGAALATNSCQPYASWIYSGHRQPKFTKNGTGSGTYTLITFTNGAVAHVLGQKQDSLSTMTFGRDIGFLPLRQGESEKLTGLSPDQIKARFGSPTAMFDFKACKLLRYSASPKSWNYFIRSVGIDEAGKIVYIANGIYWD